MNKKKEEELVKPNHHEIIRLWMMKDSRYNVFSWTTEVTMREVFGDLVNNPRLSQEERIERAEDFLIYLEDRLHKKIPDKQILLGIVSF